MADEAVFDNEYNPKMPQGNGGFTVYGAKPENSRFSDYAKRITGFAKNNKGKLIGFAGFGGISIILTVFGTLLAGPMQIVHAGQVIGEVIDTARDITNSARLARNIQRAGKALTTTKQNARVSTFLGISARNFEKKLNEAGFEIKGGSDFDSIAKRIDTTAINNSGALKNIDGKVMNVDLSPREFRHALSDVINEMPGSQIYKHIMKRTLNKMYGVAWYQGFTRISAEAATTLANKAASSTEKLAAWLESMSKNTSTSLKKGALRVASDSAGGIAARLGAKTAKGIRAIPGLGTIVGGIIGFAFNQYFDDQKIQEVLISSLIVSGVIATTADNIRNGNIPNTDANGNSMPQQDYLNYFSKQYIYDDITTDRLEKTAAAAEGDSCDGLTQGSDEYNSCISDTLTTAEETLASAADTTTGSSFFSNTPLESEFDPNFAVSEGSAEYYRGVPAQLTEVGVDKTWENIGNEVIASVTIVGPKDIEDMMEGEFYAETQIPSYIGGTAMYGARVQQNDLSASEGAYPLTQQEEVSLQREKQTYLAEQQMNKSLFARLFDVEDYHSGIATLSRDANWDLSDASVTTQFANVFRTFAAIPTLVAKSLGTYTRAASAASVQTYNYGFNMVAYTPAQVEAEPDYWDAEAFLYGDDDNNNNFNRIKKDTLKKCTGATITKDNMGLKVTWGEPSITKVELSNSNACSNYFGEQDDINEFTSYDANGNQRYYSGEDAVRSFIANYKLLASYSATSFDEMTDTEINEALEGTNLTKAEVEKSLIKDMENLGIVYTSSSNTPSKVGGGANCSGAKDCAEKMLANENVELLDGARRDMENMASTGNTTSVCGGNIVIAPNLLDAILQLSGKYKVLINNFNIGHECDEFQHPKGLAVDYNGIKNLETQESTSWGNITFTSDEITIMRQYIQDFVDVAVIPDNLTKIGIGQTQAVGGWNINTTKPLSEFEDVAHHLHLHFQ